MGLQGMHIKGKYNVIKHLDFILLDVFSMIISFVLAYYIKFRDFSFIDSESWKSILIVSCLIDLMVILFTGPFSAVLRRGGSDELLQSVKQTMRNMVFCSLALYVMKCGATFSRTVIILMYIFYCLTTVFLRMQWKKVVRARLSLSGAAQNIFVVGNRENMCHLLSNINSGFLLQYNVAGICMIDGEIGEKVTAEIDIIGAENEVQKKKLEFTNETSVADITKFVLGHNIDEVFIADNPAVLSMDTYKTLRENGKEIHLEISTLFGFAPADQYISTVGTFKTLTIADHTLDGKQMEYMTIKRLMDLFFGLIGLIVLLPLMLVVKISYLASGDTKPIFYTQTRVGLNGRTFKLYKFRSMVYNADEILQELLKDPKYKAEWDERQKFDHDPRITKIGNILRKTSMDEMPQFLNVLKGDMSVIGPRPLVVGELEQHGGLQKYNDVKPGITGWWGCNGRSNTTYEERLDLEYYYVENCSLYLDLLCFVKTFAIILKKDGAQ